MNPELDIYGVFVPTVAMLGLVAYLLSALVCRLLDRAGLYTLVWHRPLFDMALLVCILAGLVEAAYKVIL